MSGLIYLNELSMEWDAPIKDNWEKIKVFGMVLESLKNFGIDKIEVPKDFQNRRICDMEYRLCYDTVNDEQLKREQKQYLLSWMSYFHKCSELLDDVCFHIDSIGESKLLGKCHAEYAPMLSFTFNSFFEKRNIAGVFRQSQKTKTVSILNFYKEVTIQDLPILINKKRSRTLKPLDNPMWNYEAAKKYRELINFSSKCIIDHPQEKIRVLLKVGGMIARLNGWEELSVLSSLNSNRDHIRRIFYSAYFSETNCYLSIDLEKVDVFYELLDKRGRHVCEIKWDGTISDKKDNSGHHDIILKGRS